MITDVMRARNKAITITMFFLINAIKKEECLLLCKTISLISNGDYTAPGEKLKYPPANSYAFSIIFL